MATEWQKFAHFFRKEQVPAKTVLLREGQVARKIYYIEKGCFRLALNSEGKDITCRFFFEGDGISSAESFKYARPSLYTIESIESSIVYTLDKENFQVMISQSPAIKEELEERTFQHLLTMEKLFVSRIKNSPEKRYEELITQYPHILQRVPQHYVASFLGITPVSLSRIRNRR